MKKVAILQSNYIPWKGYFDMIASVDEFILYDDMQYTRRDWRNRNQIKTPQGVQWLTIPVQVKGRYEQTIRETEIEASSGWASAHWKTLEQNYKRAAHFDEIAAWLRPIYLDRECRYLSQMNRTLIEAICGYLGISTRITNSWDYQLVEGKTERLADLCAQAGATEYVSGPSAKGYIDETVFAARHIELSWFDYAGYPEYPQLWGEFTHAVTILDLLFNCGQSARQHMKYVRL
ncbi:WbqC family protein [Cupriavidus campinensis]